MLWDWVLGGHRDQGSRWCSYLQEENLSSVVEWRAFKALQPWWGQHKISFKCSLWWCLCKHTVPIQSCNTCSCMLHSCLFREECPRGFRPDRSQHWPPCSTHQKQADEIEANAGRHWNTCSRATQAAPTCYRDMYIDHRTVLDCSDSFQHPSCPYWFGPSPPRCAPVVLISNTLSFFFPSKRTKAREKRREEKKVAGGRKEKGETKEKRQKKRHRLWQERHQTSPPPPALDRQEHGGRGAPGRYLLFNTWAYQPTALSYIF